jgi:hypothetical protein
MRHHADLSQRTGPLLRQARRLMRRGRQKVAV